MKKLKTTLTLSVAGLLFLSNNCLAATAETSSTATNITKYIAIGIAVVVIILLLILGYKMDSRENDEPNYDNKKNKKLSKKKDIDVKEDPKYEADNIVYEKDNVSSDDLVEPMEFEESLENDESLFSSMDNIDENEDSATGEEFDTSIVDELNDFSEDEIADSFNDGINDSEKQTDDENIQEVEDVKKEKEPKKKKAKKEKKDTATILEELEKTENPEAVGEEFDTSIIDKIDDEDEIEIPKKSMEETMIFDNTDKENKEEPLVEKNPKKRFTKSKKTSKATDDFLAQLEKNLNEDKK